jgi:type III secretory pathway component EscS
MYPTTLAGVVLLIAAGLYAARPDLRRLHIVKCLSVLTLLVSTLGFVTGVIKAFTSIGDSTLPDIGKVVVMGVGEALTNIGLGLVMLVIAWIATSIGAARSRAIALSGGAELSDPLAP